MWQPNCTGGPSPSILRRMDLFEDPSERGKVGPDDQQHVFNCRAYAISNWFLRVKFYWFRWETHLCCRFTVFIRYFLTTLRLFCEVKKPPFCPNHLSLSNINIMLIKIRKAIRAAPNVPLKIQLYTQQTQYYYLKSCYKNSKQESIF